MYLAVIVTGSAPAMNDMVNDGGSLQSVSTSLPENIVAINKRKKTLRNF